MFKSKMNFIQYVPVFYLLSKQLACLPVIRLTSTRNTRPVFLTTKVIDVLGTTDIRTFPMKIYPLYYGELFITSFSLPFDQKHEIIMKESVNL